MHDGFAKNDPTLPVIPGGVEDEERVVTVPVPVPVPVPVQVPRAVMVTFVMVPVHDEPA